MSTPTPPPPSPWVQIYVTTSRDGDIESTMVYASITSGQVRSYSPDGLAALRSYLERDVQTLTSYLVWLSVRVPEDAVHVLPMDPVFVQTRFAWLRRAHKLAPTWIHLIGKTTGPESAPVVEVYANEETGDLYGLTPEMPDPLWAILGRPLGRPVLRWCCAHNRHIPRGLHKLDVEPERVLAMTASQRSLYDGLRALDKAGR